MMDRIEEAWPLFLAEFNLRALVRTAALEQGKHIAIFWRQRSKFHANKLGDENTKFHHMLLWCNGDATKFKLSKLLMVHL
jgi:hypothetical protein